MIWRHSAYLFRGQRGVYWRVYYETKRRPHYIFEENNYYQDQVEARSILEKARR